MQENNPSECIRRLDARGSAPVSATLNKFPHQQHHGDVRLVRSKVERYFVAFHRVIDISQDVV